MESMLSSQLHRDAARMVRESSMIARAARGDASLLLSTFWPFVDEFPLIISRRLSFSKMLLQGISLHRLRAMSKAVRTMAEEEGEHSELWAESAVCHGAVYPASCDSRVQALLDVLNYDRSMWRFLSRLAATEFVAEELALHLGTILGRWSEAHLMVHDNLPSHLDMDIELAINCHPSGCLSEIESVVKSYIDLFARAAVVV